MNKILLIIKREYFTRVKKKSFILMTFLVPALFIGMYALVIYLVVNKDEFSDAQKIAVVDETGDFGTKLKSSSSLIFTYPGKEFKEVKEKFADSKDDYLLHIPADKQNIILLGKKKPGISTADFIEDQLRQLSRTKRLLAAGIDTALLNSKIDKIEVGTRQLTEEGEKDAGVVIAYAIGLGSAFMIYMSLFIYGVQVMRGVIEEKTSRIIEVVISSVKPFQLMLGKIIGVGMVGLTQYLLWILLTFGLAAGGISMMKKESVDKVKNNEVVNGSPQAQMVKKAPSSEGEKFMKSIQSVEWGYTLSTFLFYFLFGFFLYSAVFAAVGSAVDSETETQQFMLPITLPLIFTFIISMNFVITSPDSSLAFWLSIIPFTSPIAMMVRLPFGVPAWELALSITLMIATFLFVTWMAARIYRVGILMYGKKASYKELAKWFMYKE